MNVADVIGTAYTDNEDAWTWLDRRKGQYGGGNCIFISAPTGSGKSYFILNIWLKYLASENLRMLYLVNRSILKKDIEEKVSKLEPAISCFIEVKLYQDIEYELKAKEKEEQKGVKGGVFTYKDMWNGSEYGYDCVVCDECHYFLADSNYNVDTALSFRWIQDCFSDKIRIYMSATIKDIREYIRAYDYERVYKCKNKINKYNFVDIKLWKEEEPEIDWEFQEKWCNVLVCKYYEYEIDRNYNYLDVHLMGNVRKKNEKVNEITEVIEKTDQKCEGNELSEGIERAEQKCDDILEYIDTGNKKEKWLIFVDNLEAGEKLQERLGSERAVFISSRNKRHEGKAEVVNEIVVNEKTEKQIIIATSVLDNGINLKDTELKNVILMTDTETEFIQMLGRKRKGQESLNVYIYPRNKGYFKKRYSDVLRMQKIAKEYVHDFLKARNKYSMLFDEDLAIKNLHIELMNKIGYNQIDIRDVKCLFNIYGGIWHLNLLAYQNINNLCNYYEEVLEEFEKDGDNAFAKIQLRWIGIEGEKADGIIMESKSTKEEVCREKVVKEIEEACKKTLSKDENKELKKKIVKELIFLVESTKECGYGKVLDNLKRNSNPLTDKQMVYLSKYCGIPYKVVCNDAKYIFSKIEQSETQDEE